MCTNHHYERISNLTYRRELHEAGNEDVLHVVVHQLDGVKEMKQGYVPHLDKEGLRGISHGQRCVDEVEAQCSVFHDHRRVI